MGNFLSEDRPKDAWADNPPLNVPILPLDLFIEKRADLSSGRIMLKVDVEGFEPEVIAGAEGLLASGRIAAVTFEGMVRQLKGHGFRIYWFPHLHLPCALIPWVAGNGTGNLVALGPDLESDHAYDGSFAPYTRPPPPMKVDFSRADQRDLTERLIEHRASDGWRWANPRNMEEGAETRAALASPHIPAKSRILDLGAGLMKMALRLKVGNAYTPVDLVRYAESTVLTDLNEGGFPAGEWDCALALELFEHIHDVPALLTKIRASAGRLICTYNCLEEVSDKTERRELGSRISPLDNDLPFILVTVRTSGNQHGRALAVGDDGDRHGDYAPACLFVRPHEPDEADLPSWTVEVDGAAERGFLGGLFPCHAPRSPHV